MAARNGISMIVGLGNPGTDYADSRHNVGLAVAKKFAEGHSIRLRRKRKLRSLIGAGTIGGTKVVVVIPTTFMNRSGDAVACAVGFYGVHPKDLLVIVDDVNLPLGALRIRSKGSDGGHNGLKSVISCLGTSDFPRLRVGIGGDTCESLTDFVLGKFTEEEKAVVTKGFELGAEAADTVVTEGVGSAMNKYNRAIETPEFDQKGTTT